MKEQELQFRLNDEILENLSRQMKINKQLIERIRGLEMAGVKSDDKVCGMCGQPLAPDHSCGSYTDKKKFEAFYQTNHNNPSFLPMWNYFQEMYSDKPANIGKIKELKKEFEQEFSLDADRPNMDRREIIMADMYDSIKDDMWTWFEPYLDTATIKEEAVREFAKFTLNKGILNTTYEKHKSDIGEFDLHYGDYFKDADRLDTLRRLFMEDVEQYLKEGKSDERSKGGSK